MQGLRRITKPSPKLGRPVSRTRPKGVTLLELLLALALTGIVMVVIAMAIELNLRILDTRRSDVEQTQVARAVLRHMATDIRSAVWYEPLDMTGIETLIAGAGVPELLEGLDDLAGGSEGGDSGGDAGDSGSDDGGGDSGGGQDAGGGRDEGGMPDDGGMPDAGGGMDSGMDDIGMEDFEADLGLDLGLDGGVTINTLDIAGTVEPTSIPGLYGNQYELQVDVSRLPRVDQYETVLSADDPTAVPDLPSDVKTIAYYLNMDEALAEGPSANVSLTGGSGLMRRQVDRAVSSWSASSGTLDATEHPGEMLAPEVNYLEFRYFDGIDWVTEWDSEEIGSLPLAIEITIGIDPFYGMDPETMDVGVIEDMNNLLTTDHLYRLVVYLPMGKPVPMEEDSLDMLLME